MINAPKLYFLCGKMAAGKSTLAKEIARTSQAVLLVEDEFLAKLFPGEIRDIQDYIRCSARVKDALEALIYSLLSKGISVVLDFPGNTRNQRSWFGRLSERGKVAHEFHFVDATDEICKRQLRERSSDLPENSAFTTEAEFDAVTAYFQRPSVEEGFNVIVHART